MSLSLSSALTAFGAYRRARFWCSGRPGRADLERHQQKELQRFLQKALQEADYYRSLPKPHALTDLPVTGKATLMAAFDRFNTPKITAEQGWQAFAGSRRIGPFTVGASTGTSGNRGLFVISERERFMWLGTIVAKAIPDFWRNRDRVAVVLPLDTPLYDAANETRLLRLKFFDLAEGPQSWRQDFELFDPSVVVAPPKILRWMAEAHVKMRPRRLFSAAETLDPSDRAAIEHGYSLPLGEIYMATEGLFAVTCRHGVLHLAEDIVHFEFEPVGDGLVSPLVTAFARHTQVMARYRMNDLLRLRARPCACGSPLQAVAEIVGRADDCFQLPATDGTTVLITPDILRNAILDSDRRITDFRLIQTGPAAISLALPPILPTEAVEAARNAVQNLLRRRGATAQIFACRQRLALDTSRKLRRIENRSGRSFSCAI